MTLASPEVAAAASPAARARAWRPAWTRAERPLDWLGVLPFFLFATVFLILPTMQIVFGAFQDGRGGWTFENVLALNTGTTRNAYWVSIRVSFWSAVVGCLAGFALGAAIVFGGVPRAVRRPIMTFSGVASQFAGVPLAFAFIATIGPVGLLTLWLRADLGINLRAYGFNLFSTYGLVIVYSFFQIPLMVLIVVPALDGLRREWREAAASLGATGLQYWRIVALPILFPTIVATMALLFANAFGTVATAIALAGPGLNIAPILLYAQIRGNVLGDPNLGYALALGMIVVTALANLVYVVLRARSERWLR